MYFKIEDAKYWYEIDGNGPPVVLFHGFTGSTSTWYSVIPVLKEHFQIITVDLPGHGKTRTQSPRTMEACCFDIKQLLFHLKLSEVHLVGYSMGGRTALSFAMFYPEMVTSLCLESSSPGLNSTEERMNRAANDEKLASKIEQDGLIAFVHYWENIPLFHTQKRLSAVVQQSIRQERLAQTEEGLARSLRYMGNGKQPSWWSELTRFEKPVLLVVGSDDQKFIQINKRMKKRIKSSDLVIVDNSGHAIHVEQPKIFGKIVTAFILKINSL
ncbi:2-succinyl-6-hydroxy-2,4-cyclohexadiene-1-carboxylate synthase [Virgibacillus alimentarius]|uniref:Putative 2-succinyl-6-hydroxy-2,4-cyclohexadiene-1-carboxylate synthase n=1 Tax=Virgibacillus alimentarius TaxID=698769 RepID=A0ABS4S795_9BACI|nr:MULTISPECIES: 2-succinyl-6-hydroxy-2,4-cyclohexadiene-1-carboxylate synthase [Virgibacillus]MBP2257289.1 2-succinyl-6-hydroxy-2,4-cyclohexadiene-1-carboxylate synthase [Virgibacillus alimentarius]HLR67851.1 2-succinyl-6-hydroxy-2,4-cyclohexadiene-1-carboxylate synthase [Virgibacillus sp.]